MLQICPKIWQASTHACRSYYPKVQKTVIDTYGFVDTRQENRSCPGPAACNNHLGAMSHSTMSIDMSKIIWKLWMFICLFVRLFDRRVVIDTYGFEDNHQENMTIDELSTF